MYVTFHQHWQLINEYCTTVKLNLPFVAQDSVVKFYLGIYKI